MAAHRGGFRLGRQSIVKALRASLNRLGLQSIQLYQARICCAQSTLPCSMRVGEVGLSEMLLSVLA